MRTEEETETRPIAAKIPTEGHYAIWEAINRDESYGLVRSSIVYRRTGELVGHLGKDTFSIIDGRGLGLNERHETIARLVQEALWKE